MKKLITSTIIVFTALYFSIDSISIAADKAHHSSQHHQQQPTPSTDNTLVEGLVKKIDKLAGKVTLTHGPLPNGMPGMTMVFRVKEAHWLDKMIEGQKILFSADQIDGVMTIVRVKIIK